MKITYTGSSAFTPAQQKKFESKLVKLGKLLDRGGEKEARVVLGSQRHLQRAEITVQYYDHAMVGAGSNGDLIQAGLEAIDKLEKQIVKTRERWRDTKRRPAAKNLRSEPAAVAPVGKKKAAAAAKAAPVEPKPARVFKVSENKRKPMTMEEAMLEVADGKNYVVFRDADTNRMNVLVRRPDGHLDLIES